MQATQSRLAERPGVSSPSQGYQRQLGELTPADRVCTHQSGLSVLWALQTVGDLRLSRLWCVHWRLPVDQVAASHSKVYGNRLGGEICPAPQVSKRFAQGPAQLQMVSNRGDAVVVGGANMERVSTPSPLYLGA